MDALDNLLAPDEVLDLKYYRLIDVDGKCNPVTSLFLTMLADKT
jgi:hypothetical protein